MFELLTLAPCPAAASYLLDYTLRAMKMAVASDVGLESVRAATHIVSTGQGCAVGVTASLARTPDDDSKLLSFYQLTVLETTVFDHTCRGMRHRACLSSHPCPVARWWVENNRSSATLTAIALLVCFMLLAERGGESTECW